jgi:hypothetical protein
VKTISLKKMILNFLQLFIILGFLLSLVYNQEIYYEDIRKEFTESLIRIYCPSSAYENETTTFPLTSCYERVSHNIRSLKLAEFYNRKRELEVKITSFYHIHDLLRRKPNPTTLLFSSDYSEVVSFHEKLQLLQDYADNKQIQKICIIGSNLGYSLLNFLVANPLAHFLVFDNIGTFLLPSDPSSSSTISPDPTLESTTATTGKNKIDRGSVNLLSKISLEMIIEMFPDRIINIISGNTISSLPNFNKEFPDKMDCNLLFIDGQKQLLSSLSSFSSSASASEAAASPSSTSATPSTSFLSDLRQAIQLLSPSYNRLIVDSYHLSDLSSLFSYFSNKINERIECPSKIALKQRKSCLQKNLQQNLQTMTQQQQQQQGHGDSGAAALMNGASCENYCNVRLSYRQKEKGFLLTPCVAMYSNVTDGSHIEFVFDYNNCQMNYFFDKLPQTSIDDATIPIDGGSIGSTAPIIPGLSRYSTVVMDYNNGGKSELLIDSIHELVVVELQYY